MGTYEVVYPLGRRAQQRKARAVRPHSLDGLTIGELSNHKFDSEFTFEVIEKALLRRFPSVRFVSHREFGDNYGAHESDVINALPDKLKAFECDLVISGTAG
jgi:hypothetical protein